MQKESDPLLSSDAPKLLGHRDEMIIMHPDDIVRLEKRRECVGEEGIDSNIGGEVAPGEVHEIESIMEQRPQRGIGKAAVVAIVIRATEIDGRVGDTIGLQNV